MAGIKQKFDISLKKSLFHEEERKKLKYMK
jgi:hypothetical protein